MSFHIFLIGVKQKIVIAIVFLGVFYGGFKFFQGPEKYLLKKTKHLIFLGSQVGNSISLSSSMKLSEISKYIHYDLQLEAEYEGRVYKARSLNEFRSLLMAYFKAKVTQKLEHEDLRVELKDEKTGEVSFSVTFHNINTVWTCKVLLIWIKDKKWFIKNMNIKNCKKI